MDDQNKSVNDRWAPPTDPSERGYTSDPGFPVGDEYTSRPDSRTAGNVDDETAERTSEIRGEIDETRAEMGETIDAIQERLRPGNVASRAAESVREATVGRVQEFVGDITGRNRSRDRTSNDDWRYQSHTVDRSPGAVVLDRIRSNPMAAAMAAGSIAWLIFGNRRDDERQRWSKNDRERAIYGSTRGGEAFIEERRIDLDERAGSYGGRARGQWAETASERGDEWGESAHNMMDRARDAASEAGDRMRDAASTARRRTRRFASDSPFVAGAVAAAVGLAIGLTIPETERENEMLGEARDSMVDRGKDAVRTAAERVQAAAGEVQRVAGDALRGVTKSPTESPAADTPAESGGTSATPITKSQTGKTRTR